MKKRHFLYIFLLLLIQLPVVTYEAQTTTEYEFSYEESIVEDNSEEKTLFEICPLTSHHTLSLSCMRDTLSLFTQYLKFSIFRPPIV